MKHLALSFAHGDDGTKTNATCGRSIDLHAIAGVAGQTFACGRLAAQKPVQHPWFVQFFKNGSDVWIFELQRELGSSSIQAQSDD